MRFSLALEPWPCSTLAAVFRAGLDADLGVLAFFAVMGREFADPGLIGRTLLGGGHEKARTGRA